MVPKKLEISLFVVPLDLNIAGKQAEVELAILTTAPVIGRLDLAAL